MRIFGDAVMMECDRTVHLLKAVVPVQTAGVFRALQAVPTSAADVRPQLEAFMVDFFALVHAGGHALSSEQGSARCRFIQAVDCHAFDAACVAV